jgi:hypothetical protein
MSRFLIGVILVALVAVGFAGCIGAAPGIIKPNRYDTGDIISNDQNADWGYMILKYDTKGDRYVFRQISKYEKGGWIWSEYQPKESPRNVVEERAPYKIGYISDPATVINGLIIEG